jgi:carboxypeptidase PM20D1
VSDTNSQSFNLLQKTIRQIFDDALIAPSLTVGASDSRHYGALSQNIYRFGPMRGTPEDLARVHGTNERLSIDNYEQAIKFYIQLIRNSNP